MPDTPPYLPFDPEDIPVADGYSREDFGTPDEVRGWNLCREYVIDMLRGNAAPPCCASHHYEGCCDGTPGCCPDCPINPWRDVDGQPTRDFREACGTGGSTPNPTEATATNANERTPCPTCSGPIRETVGMVCQTCGTDYSLPAGPSS